MSISILDSSPTALTETLRDFAQAVAERQGVVEILQHLGDYSITQLGVDGAGVLLEDRDGHLRFATSTDELAHGLEQLQIGLGEGPCMTCFSEIRQVHVPDVAAAADRWPEFAPAAAELGIGAIYAFPLIQRTHAIGSLNLLRLAPADLSPAEAAVGQLLADVASSYVVNSLAFAASSELAEQLQRALDSRVIIEQAKGRLAERLGIGAQEAFELLRNHARRNNRNIHDVARDLLAARHDL